MFVYCKQRRVDTESDQYKTSGEKNRDWGEEGVITIDAKKQYLMLRRRVKTTLNYSHIFVTNDRLIEY